MNLPEPIKGFVDANPWVLLVVLLVVLYLAIVILSKIFKSLKRSATTGSMGGKINHVLSKFQIGTADVIPNSRCTVVEITNTSSIPFVVQQVILLKNGKTEFPLKLPYKGRISPPRTLPKHNELHQGRAELHTEDTFVFSHPINSFFVLNDNESFQVIIDVAFEANGSTERLRFTSRSLRKKHIQKW